MIRMTIDPKGDRPVYRQLADLLRADIVSGRLGPGSGLPSENHIGQQHGLGREAVRQAFGILRAEGLIVTERGTGSRVRELPPRQELRLKRGDRALVRMPSDPERRALDIHEGVPLIEVHYADGSVEALPGDTTELVV